jgi:hypothetical protein
VLVATGDAVETALCDGPTLTALAALANHEKKRHEQPSIVVPAEQGGLGNGHW